MHAAFVIPTNLEMTFTIRESIDIQTIVRVRNIWGKTFFSFSLSLQIPCLIRFIVQVLSNFFERVLYNVAKLLKSIITNSTILFRPGFHCHIFLHLLSHFDKEKNRKTPAQARIRTRDLQVRRSM